MFGNVVNKPRLKDLLARQAISIGTFNVAKTRAIHYPLTPVHVYRRGSEDARGRAELSLQKDFRTSDAHYVLHPNEYVIIEVLEQITMLQDGLIGHFVTPSHFIERGLGLIAGRIESPYGQRGKARALG